MAGQLFDDQVVIVTGSGRGIGAAAETPGIPWDVPRFRKKAPAESS